jgi:SAM-dependent methyltransferase
MTSPVPPWNRYWDSLPDGHLFFPAEGEEAVRNLTAAVPLTPDTTALDFGCGYGMTAAPLAQRVGRLWVWDQSGRMRAFARRHLAAHPNVREWDPADTATTFDLVWVNSVVQYMSEPALSDRLTQFAPLLRPGGCVVLSDLIPPAHPFRKDALSLLGFSLRRGYLLRAFLRTRSLARKYDAQKKDAPLYQPSREGVERLAATAGFAVRWLDHNLTHFRHRQTAILTRATP